MNDKRGKKQVYLQLILVYWHVVLELIAVLLVYGRKNVAGFMINRKK